MYEKKVCDLRYNADLRINRSRHAKGVQHLISINIPYGHWSTDEPVYWIPSALTSCITSPLLLQYWDTGPGRGRAQPSPVLNGCQDVSAWSTLLRPRQLPVTLPSTGLLNPLTFSLSNDLFLRAYGSKAINIRRCVSTEGLNERHVNAIRIREKGRGGGAGFLC